MYYWKKMKKYEIAEIFGVGGSAVSKSLKTAEDKIKAYIEMYMEVYDFVKRNHEIKEDELNKKCGGQYKHAGH